MRISDLIAYVDNVKPNTYKDPQKIVWLNTVEGKIFKEIIETHENTENIDFTGYDENAMELELIAKEPYCDLYSYYLMSMIDFYNQETEAYMNDAAMFNVTYQNFANYWNRTYRSIGPTGFRM